MKLRVGTFDFEANGTEITARTEIFRNQATIPYKRRTILSCAGWLSIAGSTPATQQADCTQQMNALATLLAKPYQDIVFLDDNGAETATQLKNNGSVGGVVVTAGPHFPDGTTGYTAVQRFEFTAEAEYYLTGLNTNTFLLDFTEGLDFEGGGPRYVYKEAIRAMPQKQMPCKNTMYRVVQSGASSGLRGFPRPPAPKWPQNLLTQPRITKKGPKRVGPNSYEQYDITWSYEFGSATPLNGVPTLWVG